MSNKAVIGLGYGDEGKGVTTEYLCSQDPGNTIVVRFSGGQQAGHKVIKGETEHIFSNFGAGTLSGCPTYWSQYCTFDPMGMLKEMSILKGKGLNPELYIHPLCAVTTPYDRAANQCSVEVEHGTCGQGIFKTKNRTTHGITLTVADLVFLTPLHLDGMLRAIKSYYQVDQLDLTDFWNSVYDLRTLINKNIFITNDIPSKYNHVIFEGSQGLMLDEFIGQMPHCTPSDVTVRPVIELANGPLDEVFIVTRSYQTRHGNGPMTNENHPVELVNNEKETNKTNPWQGEFRTSVLDLDQLIHAKQKGIDKFIHPETKVNLVITCMDQMSEYLVSKEGKINSFTKAEDFVNFLGSELEINGKVYINTGPRSQLFNIAGW